jgi:hypothetical protein
MSFRDRIRRIENKLAAAVNPDGQKLPVPIIESVYVEGVEDPDTGECRLKEIQFALVERKTYEREPGETFEHFEKRMVAKLPPPEYPFAQKITFR